MTRNMGGLDRGLRVALGLALLAFAIFNPLAVGWSWVGWIGVVPLLTSAIGWCPAYSLVGLSTCPMKKA